MVARARGAKIENGRGGYVTYMDGSYDALRDITEWLGFGNGLDAEARYLAALKKERRAIFKRATR